MAKNSRIPFQNMTTENWQNLALAALAVFFIIQIGLDVLWRNTCGHLGVDFCAFWSAGQIANAHSYADIYNLNMLGSLERTLFPKFGDPATFAISPIAYLPIFMLPFQLFALIPVEPSLWIWLALNFAVLIFYLRFFIRQVSGQPLQTRLLVMLLLSLPVYWNFLEGQVNVWLMICVGEYVRAMLSDRPFRAGLWLGGLLLKPQTLILIGLVLLLQRSIKALAGLAVTSFGLIGVSLAMIGMNGFMEMIQVWLGFGKGMATNDVEVMMNWRMLELHLSSLTNPLVGWIIAGAGVLITIAIALYIWRRPIDAHSSAFMVALLGLLAAAALVAWHSHIHMVMFLIPPLILLEHKHQLPKNAFAVWVFIPSLAFILSTMLASTVQAGALPNSVGEFLDFMRGASEFTLNIYLLWWAFMTLKQKQDRVSA